MDTSVNWRLYGCRLVVRFLNSAMNCCNLAKDMPLYAYNGAKYLLAGVSKSDQRLHDKLCVGVVDRGIMLVVEIVDGREFYLALGTYDKECDQHKQNFKQRYAAVFFLILSF